MISPTETADQLKHILENIQTPSRLDEHAWTGSLVVTQYLAENPAASNLSPGYRLLAALSALFRETMPSTPPREGKRLDTHWGRFGILAALYFAPFEHGTIRPTSLLDAWGRIDQVLPMFVFEEPDYRLSTKHLALYRLFEDESEAVPTSTLSDWHVRGLEHLADALINRERLLSARLKRTSILLDPSQAGGAETGPGRKLLHTLSSRIRVGYRQYGRWIWPLLASLVVLLFGWYAWRMISLTRTVKGHLAGFQAVIGAGEVDISPEMIEEIGPMLETTRKDVLALQARTVPFLWAGRLLGWLPVYGGDLASAEALLDLAAGLVIAGDEAYQSAAPLLAGMDGGEARPPIPEILDVLVAAQPHFDVAQASVEGALAARSEIDIERLSPKTRPLLEKIDPYLPLLRDGIPALKAVPKVLGSEEFGPQTYLILIQNEDEIRATGGFITAAATITVEKGEIIAFKVEDSYSFDDLSRQYPAPPWQLEKFILAWMFSFRNSNWSPDYPTTATWAEYLYAYGSAHSVDGVFAIDQRLLILLLEVLGPVELPDAPEPITTENVIAFMHAAKNEFQANDPARKSFMGTLAKALLEKLQGDPNLSWQKIGDAVLQALNERHILLQFDDPAMTAFIASRGWDGALRPGDGDFLMVVDSNLGWNKVNAAAWTEINHSVDLSAIKNPQASLTITHINPTAGDEPCRHASYVTTGEYDGLIERCYWNYLRVYTLEESKLLDTALHMVPATWFIREEIVPAQVDVLNNDAVVREYPPGLRGFGTMVVIPLSEERQTRFEFALPQRVLQEQDEFLTYQLHIQKQPGTIANPVAIDVRLPEGAKLISAEPGGTFQAGIWRSDLDLRTDIDIRLVFQIP